MREIATLSPQALWAAASLCCLLLPTRGAGAQERPPIGVIDFYGLQTLSEERVRSELGFVEGDAPSRFDFGPEAGARIAAALGVARVELQLVC